MTGSRRVTAGAVRLLVTVTPCLVALSTQAASLPAHLASPDNRLRLTFDLTDEGEPHYSVSLNDRPVLHESRLGLVRKDADFSRSLELVSASAVEIVRDQYELLTSKRRQNSYTANRQVFHLEAPGGDRMEIQFQVSDDGVAFRYRFPEHNATMHRIESEASTFHFPEDTKAWLQPAARAKTGWASTNPSYEEIYEKDVPAGTPSPTGAGWVYPALFRSGETWLLVSETGLNRNYCGTRLQIDLAQP